MAVGMGKKAVGETLHSPEVLMPEQRIIDFVNQTAVFKGGETIDVVKAGVLTNILAGGGLVLRSRLIDTSQKMDGGQLTRTIEAVFPGGCSDFVEIDEIKRFTYGFGEDGTFEDLDDQEREATVTAFFIRYNLDYYAQHPELWRPEALRRG